jgi:HAE1 family hydrophobic/amphiphilic exporter-1
MMGFIALSGIVVNNAIILIDVMNNLRASEPDSPLHALVIRGATSRLRPVLLTTVTTIIGVIPLSFVSALWAPLAIAIMSGLITAAGITLILIPVIYHRWPGTPEAVAANTNAESSAPTS